MTINKMLAIWSKVTRKDIVSFSTTFEEYSAPWPVAGEELASRMCFNVNVPD
jgi:hypothetical protein